MAIYHLSVKTVSRSAGHSATAAAAYRAGEKITDERTGEIHDYAKRKGVAHTEMIFPEFARKTDRETLWNRAEASEKRKNSTVAREYEIALPHELDREEKVRLTREYSQWLAGRFGVAVDVAIHEPGQGGDSRNWHAHILTTTRVYEANGSLGAKTRELDDKKSGAIFEVREEWEKRVNLALIKSRELLWDDGPPQVSSKSHKERGLETLPTKHMGKAQTWIERKGVETKLGKLNRLISAANRELIEAEKRIKAMVAAIGKVFEQKPTTAPVPTPAPKRSDPVALMEERVQKLQEGKDRPIYADETEDAKKRLWKRGVMDRELTAEMVEKEALRAREAEIGLLQQAVKEKRWMPPGAALPGLDDLCTKLAARDEQKAAKEGPSIQSRAELIGRMLILAEEQRNGAKMPDDRRQAILAGTIKSLTDRPERLEATEKQYTREIQAFKAAIERQKQLPTKEIVRAKTPDRGWSR